MNAGAAKESGLEFWIVEFEGSVFESGVSGKTPFGGINYIVENDVKRFELRMRWDTRG